MIHRSPWCQSAAFVLNPHTCDFLRVLFCLGQELSQGSNLSHCCVLTWWVLRSWCVPCSLIHEFYLFNQGLLCFYKGGIRTRGVHLFAKVNFTWHSWSRGMFSNHILVGTTLWASLRLLYIKSQTLWWVVTADQTCQEFHPWRRWVNLYSALDHALDDFQI